LTRSLFFFNLLPLVGLLFSSSCGGCLVGKGVDCSDLPGTNEVSCRSGQCIVGELCLFFLSVVVVLPLFFLFFFLPPPQRSDLTLFSPISLSLFRLLLPRMDTLNPRNLCQGLIRAPEKTRRFCSSSRVPAPLSFASSFGLLHSISLYIFLSSSICISLEHQIPLSEYHSLLL